MRFSSVMYDDGATTWLTAIILSHFEIELKNSAEIGL